MMKNNDPKQVLFCTETDKNEIDDIYVKKLLEIYFELDTSFKRTFIHMKGKSKFNDKSVITQIEKKKKDYGKINPYGKNYVVYVIDLDEYFVKYEDQKRLEDIQKFCIERGYYLVWFCRTIEEVLIGRKVENNEKLKCAVRFSRDANKSTVKEVNLKSKTICQRRSNFLEILNEIISE